MKRLCLRLSVIVAPATACTWLADRELDEFEGESSAEAPSVSGSAGSGGAVASSTGAATVATGGGGSPCGTTPAPTGGSCPEACGDDGCEDDVCTLDCDEKDECKDRTIQCAPGWPCEIDCVGEKSCERSVIRCPDELPCTLRCLGVGACLNADVIVTTGVFQVICSAAQDACKDLDVACGDNACRAECMGATKPKLTCGAACECSPCG